MNSNLNNNYHSGLSFHPIQEIPSVHPGRSRNVSRLDKRVVKSILSRELFNTSADYLVSA